MKQTICCHCKRNSSSSLLHRPVSNDKLASIVKFHSVSLCISQFCLCHNCYDYDVCTRRDGKQYEINIRHFKKSIKEQQQKITNQQQLLDELPGPFIVYFNRVLSSLTISRSDYHGRALIG